MHFQDFQRRFAREEQCLTFLFHLCHQRPICPSCGARDRYSMRSRRPSFICQCGRHEIYPRSGTVFARSKVPLRTWFYLLFLFSRRTHGISSAEIQRHLGCSMTTAWSLGMRIRSMMKEKVTLSGRVEADETLIGGKRYGGKRGRGARKHIVLGLIERGGKIQFHHIPTVQTKDMHAYFANLANIHLITDEWGSYKDISRKYGIRHTPIKHKEYIWSRGDFHTNSIEGQWAHLKKMIKGTHSMVSGKHLHAYLTERAFAYNHASSDRFCVLLERIVSS